MDASTLYRQHLPEHIRIRDIRNETAPRPEDHYAFLDQLEDILLPTWKEYRENALLRAEEEYFQNLLAFTNGDTAKAMALSGLSKAQFYKLLKRAMEE
jgi:two-component system NtrC family response regulator